jgi:hypothetical protein
MKKIIFSILCLFSLVIITKAQTSGVVISPSSFTAEDEVTITIDVTGTGMAGATDAYLWIFSNPGLSGGADGVTNGNWTNSSDTAKLTPAGPNKFTYKFTGTIMFGQTPAQLKTFGFLLKKKDGSAQTPDYKPYFFDPLIYVSTVFRTFPKFISKNDVITAYLDQTLAVDVTTQRMEPSSAEIAIFNGGTQVGTTQMVNLKSEGNKVWSYTFFLPSLFSLAANATVNKLTFKFKGTVKDVNGNNTPAESPVFEKGLDDLK